MAFRLLPTGVIVAIASGALAAPAQTQGEPPGPDTAQAEQRPLTSYGDENPSCLQWSDDCFTCARQPVGAVACSTAGAACVAAASIRCTKSAK
jgi:hypothetical protein